MIIENDGSLVVMPPVATATNTSTAMSFSKLTSDGQPCDAAIISLLVSTHATNADAIEKLVVAESDTVTSATSMTAIAALSGSLTTSTSYTNAVPDAATTGLGTIIEFQIDLRKRKKYIGLHLNSTSGTATVAAVARLVRNKSSKETAATKSKTGATYGNLAATSAVGCSLLVTG